MKKEEKINIVNKITNQQYEELVRFPKYIHLETINNCNARCTMCGIDFDKKTKTMIEDKLFDSIFTELKANVKEIEKVMLYLDGEPLLDKKIVGRIKRFTETGIRTNIATNAMLLNSEMTEKLLEAGLSEVYLALDSLDPEEFETIRVGLKHSKVLENIDNFIKVRDDKKSRTKIRVQYIDLDGDIKKKEKFTEFWKNKLAIEDEIAIQKAHNWAGEVSVIKVGDEQIIKEVPCLSLWTTLSIHVNGIVPLCCMDTTTKYKLGDLTKQSIKQIWTGHKLNSFRENHLEHGKKEIDICKNCTLWRENKRDLY